MLIPKYGLTKQDWQKIEAEKARLTKEERKILLEQKDLFELPDSQERKKKKMARYY